MTETEYIIYTITGIVAVAVGRLCYVHIYKYGKSRRITLPPTRSLKLRAETADACSQLF